MADENNDEWDRYIDSALFEYRLEQEEQAFTLNLNRKEVLYNVGDIVKFVIGYKRHRDKLLPKTDAPYKIIASNGKGSSNLTN
jgi:hypothetical protein